MCYSQSLLSRRQAAASPRKSHSKSQREAVSGDTQPRQATVEAGQVLSEPHRATPSDAQEVTGVNGSLIQTWPSRLVAELFRIYFSPPWMTFPARQARPVPVHAWVGGAQVVRTAFFDWLAQWPERRAKLFREELRLFPGGEVAALVGLVEVREVGVDLLRPAARGLEDLAGEHREGDRQRNRRRPARPAPGSPS